jgi:hypothetical protein
MLRWLRPIALPRGMTRPPGFRGFTDRARPEVARGGSGAPIAAPESRRRSERGQAAVHRDFLSDDE